MSHKRYTEQALDCDAIQDLIPDYAFGLASPEDTRLVEANLDACPEAAAHLADYRRLQEEMRAEVPQIEPPPELGERLMAAIAVPAVTAKPPRRPINRAWLAAVAAIIALVMTNVYWQVRLDDLIRRNDELARRNDELISMLGGSGDTPFVLTSTRDLRWVRLPADVADGETAAFMMWDAESDTGLLYVRDFPRLDPGKTYQLWLTRGDERVNAGTFAVDEQGNAALIFHIPDPIDHFTWARVTNEPEYGSDEPTGAVIVHGELQG